MIATDKFVFVHLPRSGGTFINAFIKKFFSSAHEIAHHMPRELLPREYSHLPILGTVRNPWEFYVSLFHYVQRRDPTSVLMSWMTENGRLGFDGGVRNLLNLGVDDQLLKILIELLPERIDYQKKPIPSISRNELQKVQGTGFGYYTLRFKQMFGNPDDLFFCRLETLNQDLIAFFESIGVATDELRDNLLASDKINGTEHLPYSAYYTPELAALVSRRDWPLIERFGYSFDLSDSPETALESTFVTLDDHPNSLEFATSNRR